MVSAHANLSTFLNLANFYQKCYINVIQKLIAQMICQFFMEDALVVGGGREEVTPPPSTFAMENG